MKIKGRNGLKNARSAFAARAMDFLRRRKLVVKCLLRAPDRNRMEISRQHRNIVERVARRKYAFCRDAENIDQSTKGRAL